MTSANVTNYTIRDLGGKEIGKHSQHAYCKTHWGDLLKFQPLENFTIQAWGLDEEEETWEDRIVSLKVFITKLKMNRFTSWETMDDIKNNIKVKEFKQ